MDTVAAAARSQGIGTRYDRLFYSSMGIGMALTALIGFGPTYYTKLYGHDPMTTFSGQPMTLLVHAHGLLFSAWVLLFIVQTALVAQPLRLVVSTTDAWKSVAQTLVNLVS